MNNITTLELTKQLISKASVTPDDAGCQQLMDEFLTAAGFNVQHLPFAEVKNIWATHGSGEPVLVMLGHTDVVPPGPLDDWTSPPFEPSERYGKLFGRGAADMKSGDAAMLIACRDFVAEHSDHKGTLAILITSDEEGPSINGTRKVIEHLQQQNQALTYCLVGEASCEAVLGDTIKVGRRGSLTGYLTINGTQGHVAYPEKANNPIHASLTALQNIIDTQWCDGNQTFPATSLQIANVNAGTGATNVIPGHMELSFNFRYSPETTAQALKDGINQHLNKHNLEYELTWQHGAEPFYTAHAGFRTAVSDAISEVLGKTTQQSTTGGTSDGRFLAPTGCQVIEFGPVNASIHQVDEHIAIADLEKLPQVYLRVLEKMLS